MVQHVRALSPSIVERLRDAESWRAMNPQLTVSHGTPAGSIERIRGRPVREEVLREGYFHLDDVFPRDVIGALHTAVDRLRARKLPPVFLFVYDEAWHFGARLAPILEELLDGPYAQVPGFWVWHLDAQREAAGWPPHRDMGPHTLHADGSPKIMTLWVPLSDATPENGCIYAVPRHLDDSYPGFVPSNLQNIRALPARAGSLLGWAHDVLHWSGRSSVRSRHDRVSFAIEFQRTDLDGPLLDGPPYTEPLLPAGSPPPLSARLSLVGQQILLYSTRYQVPDRLIALARRLVEAGDDARRILHDIEVWLARQTG